MAELVFFLGLIAPFALMAWLIVVQRKAKAAQADTWEEDRPAHSREAYEEEVMGEDGLSYGRRYDGDSSVLPPQDKSGEVELIKGFQGRR